MCQRYEQVKPELQSRILRSKPVIWVNNDHERTLISGNRHGTLDTWRGKRIEKQERVNGHYVK